MQFPDVKDRRQRKGIINGIIFIFQDEESFMEIQVSRGNGTRHSSFFRKVKIMVIKLAMRNNGRAINLFSFYFTTMLIHASFQLSSCLANVTQITRRTKNKINTISVLSRKRMFKDENFILLTNLKETLNTNLERVLNVLKKIKN